MLNISNKVKIVSCEELAHIANKKEIHRYCNKKGIVTNKEYSPETDEYYYTILFDDSKNPSDIKFTENMLINLSYNRFHMDCIVEDNVVIARMFDSENHMVSEGHGHIFNGKGKERTAQAAHFAFYRLWKECCT